jgi:hydrogenase expression/formation protein HypC
MCYAIPARILKIKGDAATVDYGGVRKNANVSMVGSVRVGDYVLIHAGFAIEKLTRRDAQESLKLVREYIELAEGRDDG